jgi:hypothetical protein
VDALRIELDKRGIPVTHLAIDDSGTQSVADVVEVEIGRGCIRCNSGSAASDRPIARLNGTPVNERYVDRGTELWIQVAELGRNRQLRGMSAEECGQFTSRRLVMAGKRKRLERKVEYKTRLKGFRSPDDADAAALCVEAARVACGLHPGEVARAPAGGHQGYYSGAPRFVIHQTLKSNNCVDL